MHRQDLTRLVKEAGNDSDFLVHRDIFRDPAIFELEMRNIFDATWVFIGLASQVPKAHDFHSTWLGRQPIVVMRDGEGRLGAFFNSCRHRGAVICHVEHGNTKYHVCQYHGWAYDSAGRNIDIKDAKRACYSDSFTSENHDLVRVPRFEEYRGMVKNRTALLFGTHLSQPGGFDATQRRLFAPVCWMGQIQHETVPLRMIFDHPQHVVHPPRHVTLAVGDQITTRACVLGLRREYVLEVDNLRVG